MGLSSTRSRWDALGGAAGREAKADVACGGSRRPCGEQNASLLGAGLQREEDVKRTVNQKVLPCPGALSTPIAPPISSTSCLLITSPKPVPPYFRVVEASICENDLKSRSRRSSGMPMPVSRTEKYKSQVASPA